MRIRGRHAAVFAFALIGAGCSSPLALLPEPAATDPVGAQAATAWGTDTPIVAWCGVTAPGPITDPCLDVNTLAGASVDLGIDQPTAVLSDLASALTFTDTVGHCY